MVQPLRHKTTENYDNNGKGWYFRFHYDNKTSFRYILSITLTSMGQFNIHVYNKIRTVTERTNLMLDTFLAEYTQQAFTHASRIFHRMCRMQVNKSA